MTDFLAVASKIEGSKKLLLAAAIAQHPSKIVCIEERRQLFFGAVPVSGEEFVRMQMWAAQLDQQQLTAIERSAEAFQAVCRIKKLAPDPFERIIFVKLTPTSIESEIR